MLARVGHWLADRIIARAQRTPYFHLDGYMNRWWLFRIGRGEIDYSGHVMPRWLGGRVHQILRSDSDRHAHDHPWPYLTIILRGGYWEEREFPSGAEGWRAACRAAGNDSEVKRHWLFKDGLVHDYVYRTMRWHGPGSILFRRSTDRHRLILSKPGELLPWKPDAPREISAWTLFITGPKRKSWFFYTEDGPIPWREYEQWKAKKERAA
jgi:hypothetical protein